MPIYDYQCAKCGHRMEVVHGVHDAGPSACPVCGGQMKKLFAPPAVHFKGTGWAKKERGSSSAPKAARSTPKSESGDGAGGGATGGNAGGADRSGTSAPASGSGES